MDNSSSKLRAAFFQNNNAGVNNNNTNSDTNFDNDVDFFAKFNDDFNKNSRSNHDEVEAFGAGTQLDNNQLHTNDTFDNGVGDTKLHNMHNKFNSLQIGGDDDKRSSSPGFEEGSFADFASFDSLNTIKQTTHDSSVHTTRSFPRSPRQLKPIRSNAFEQLNKKNLNTSNKNNNLNEKKKTKFENDYSKTDNFDDDLKAVLERSLVDQ